MITIPPQQKLIWFHTPSEHYFSRALCRVLLWHEKLKKARSVPLPFLRWPNIIMSWKEFQWIPCEFQWLLITCLLEKIKSSCCQHNKQRISYFALCLHMQGPNNWKKKVNTPHYIFSFFLSFVTVTFLNHTIYN